MNQLAEFFNKLLDSSDWPPRWHCGKWTEFHGWFYIVSDLLIWSAYFTIPLIILRYTSRKTNARFLRLYFLFAAFILACGSTHFLDAVAFWFPAYRLSALVRFITGLISWITVFHLIKILPTAFSLKSSSEFEAEIEQRKKAEKEILLLNETLEQRILDRTEALLISEKKYRDLFEKNPMPIWVLRLPSLNFIAVNEAAIISYGYSRDEFLTMTAPDIQLQEDTEHLLDLNPQQNPVRLNTITWKHRKKDGVAIYSEVDEHEIFFEGGPALMVLSNIITDRIKAQEELKKTVKEISDYKYALDESSIVAVTNQQGIISYANPNFCKISKYTKEELIGQDHRIINSGYHSKEYIRNIWLTIANGKIWRGELKNKAKDGTAYWVDTTIVPFLDDHNKPYQYVAIRADITQRKHAEDEIKHLNEELEMRVKERTEELESFSYSISHDLREPLRAVDGYASILEEDYGGVLNDEGKRILGEVQDNAKRMGILIDELLAFSRLGRKEIDRSVIDMNELSQLAIKEINQTTSHRAEIKFGQLIPVMADQALLKQVMINLISNAIKYSNNSINPFIEIKSARENNELVYSITDNGVGFEMEFAHKLFGVFQRLHSVEEFPGTGVGLAIVQRIIHKHKGKIWALSEPEKGATFYFTLPV
ncbi:MAG: PAS domain S-box protein [Ferruginibacter sp.]